jgi:hypothetical protein
MKGRVKYGLDAIHRPHGGVSDASVDEASAAAGRQLPVLRQRSDRGDHRGRRAGRNHHHLQPSRAADRHVHRDQPTRYGRHGHRSHQPGDHDDHRDRHGPGVPRTARRHEHLAVRHHAVRGQAFAPRPAEPDRQLPAARPHEVPGHLVARQPAGGDHRGHPRTAARKAPSPPDRPRARRGSGVCRSR